VYVEKVCPSQKDLEMQVRGWSLMLEDNPHSRDVQDRCTVCCTNHCLIIEMNAEKEVDFIVALSSSVRILRCHVTNNITFGSCVAGSYPTHKM
jgi:hypothetical protein